MSGETLIMIGGFVFNAIVTAGALFRFALTNERRMTRMETMLEHLTPRHPRRHDDPKEITQ